MEGGVNPQGDNSIIYVFFAAIMAVIVAFTKRINLLYPFQLMASAINGPVLDKHFEKHVAPRFDRIERKQDSQEVKMDKITRVIDHMEGADKAHAAVKAEDERWKA